MNNNFGLNLIIHFSIDLKFRYINSFLDKNFKFNSLFFFFKILANLPFPPVTNINVFNLILKILLMIDFLCLF